MRTKTIGLLSAAVLLLGLLTGCGKTGDRVRVAVITKATNSDFWHGVQSGVEAAASAYAADVTFTGPDSEEDYAAQNALIRQAVEDGADAIVLSAIDRQRNAAAVDEAAARGVKIVSIDSAVDSDAVALFIGTDDRAAGRAAGEAAVAGFVSPAEIRIGLVNIAKETANGAEREQGLRDYLAGVPNATIVAAEHAENTLADATAAAARLLREHPQINVLIGFNEWMTLGVGAAIRDADAAARVRAVGFDANVVSVAMLETGEMDALIVQDPYAIGYLGVRYAVALAGGEQAPAQPVHTTVATADRTNMFDKDMQKLLFRF